MRILSIGPMLAFVSHVVACGGTVVVQDGEGGAGGDDGVTTGTSGSQNGTSTVATTGTGPFACSTHDDCGDAPGSAVCVFSLGICAQRCGGGTPPCPPSLVCDECATATCPTCKNCMGACVAP